MEYKSGKYGIARMRNPYSLDLMAANVVGAFEILEGKPYAYTWSKDGGDLLLRVEATEDVPEVAARMYLLFPPARPGNIQFSRCKRCGVPNDVRYLQWQEDQGNIMDTRREKRVSFVIENVAGTVFREFRKELGDTVVDIIIQAQKECWLDHIAELGLLEEAAGDPERSYQTLLDTLPVLGKGNPISMQRTADLLEVVVENPFDELLVAGALAACYEAVEGTEPEVTFQTVAEGTLTLQVQPKGS